MPDASSFGEIGSRILGKILSGTVIVFLVLLLGIAILVVALVVRYYRQFNVKVEIKSLRGSGTRGEPIYKIVPDKGAMIFNKKDKRHYFRLWGEKVDLTPPPLDVMELRADGTNQIKIYQPSPEEYYYMSPDRIIVDKIVRDGQQIDFPRAEYNIVDGDVSYWNILSKRDNRKLFDTESMLMKLLPYVGIFFMFVAVIFLTYIITDHWGEFASAAQYLKEAAQALRDVSTASVTTSSGTG